MKWLKAFLDGAASLLDLGGTLSRHDPAPDPFAADRAALRRDWEAVGDDLRKAMGMEPLIERLADAEHASWARWMNWLFSVSHPNEDGSCTIPAPLVARWKRQAATRYADLSEREKESDRDEVRLILPIIEAHERDAEAHPCR